MNEHTDDTEGEAIFLIPQTCQECGSLVFSLGAPVKSCKEHSQVSHGQDYETLNY